MRISDWSSDVCSSDLTGLLALMLVVIVSGEFPFIGAGEPLGVGMATAWGVCLGTSGLLFIEVIGSRMMVGLRAMVGLPQQDATSEIDAAEKGAQRVGAAPGRAVSFRTDKSRVGK